MMDTNLIKSLRVCVFDFDGTLVDTMGGFANIAAKLLHKHYGIPPANGRLRYLETSGIPFFKQLEIIRPGGHRNQACADEFESRKLDGFFASIPSKDTTSGLDLLRRAGYKLVVSSNNFQHNLDAYLDRYPLPLELALGFDHNGLEKGLPHFVKVKDRFGVQLKEILYCGDSLKDGERAQSCQVLFVGKTGTFSRAQFLERFPGIHTVETIGELAEQLVPSDKTFEADAPRLRPSEWEIEK